MRIASASRLLVCAVVLAVVGVLAAWLSVSVGTSESAECDDIMSATGGVLGFSAKAWHSEISPLSEVGVPEWVSVCKWRLELRGLPVKHAGVVVKSGEYAGKRGTVLEANVGRREKVKVRLFGVEDQPSPPPPPPRRATAGRLSAGLARPALATPAPKRRSDGAVRLLELRSLQLDQESTRDEADRGTFPGRACAFAYYRSRRGVDTVRTPHSEAAIASLPPDMRREWALAAWEWCAPVGYWASYKRLCGHSTPYRWDPGADHNTTVTYPTRHRPVYVRAHPRMAAKRRKGNTHVKFPYLEVYSGDAEQRRLAMVTADRQGWMIAPRRRGDERAEPRDCPGGTTGAALAVFFGWTKHYKLVRTNIAHWLHDVLYPLHMTIHAHVPELDGDYLVALPPGQWEHWNVVPRGASAQWQSLLGDVAKRWVEPSPGQCFPRAVFDCPRANSMAPMAPLQRWLERHRGMAFSPLAPRLSASGSDPLLLLMVRKPKWSRHIGNWRELVRAAEELRWRVRVPLGVGDTGTTAPPQPADAGSDDGAAAVLSSSSQQSSGLLSLAADLQQTSFLVGAHGAEIAPMLFMPIGSAVLEMLPGPGMRFADQWYPRQAAASSLHMLRWALPHSAVQWSGPRDPGNVSCLPGQSIANGQCFADPAQAADKLPETGVPPHCRRSPTCLRTTPSVLLPPVGDWRRLTRYVRALVSAV